MKQLEVSSCESLAKCPIRRSRIVGDDKAAITCCDLKRESLTIHVKVALPVLAPIARHHLPTSSRPFDGDRHHISRTSNIGYQHKIEV